MSVRQKDVPYRGADGTRRVFSTNAAPIYDNDGHAIAAVCTFQDITERKQLEAQLAHSQKMESIGLLAGGIAHDFNNLLMAISGYADLVIERVSAGTEIHNDLMEIIKATDRATTLTRQLLTFAHRQEIAPRVIDLNYLIVDVDKMLRRLISEHITLSVKFESDLSPVKVDPGQIEQVVVNLVINARDAMPRGGELTIETTNVTIDYPFPCEQNDLPAGEYVMLSVKDTGIGISPKALQYVFEPFFTTKEAGKGTGLGLSTCYGIIKEHGGAITIASEQSIGTTVSIFLPYASEALSATEGNGDREMPKGNETVLVVEDQTAVRCLITRVLRSCGYSVLEAPNGVEAFHMAASHYPEPIHLLLADVVMPEMGGKDTATQLTKLYPGIHVLYMSGYAEHNNLEEGNELLQKPLAPITIAQSVRKALDSIALECGAKS